jgi:hypothetical protein
MHGEWFHLNWQLTSFPAAVLPSVPVPPVSGIHKARIPDVEGIKAILEPLEKSGVVVTRSRSDIEAMIENFIVIEREGKVRAGGERR